MMFQRDHEIVTMFLSLLCNKQTNKGFGSMTACQASFSQSSIDSGLLVAEGGYELTAAKCVQCICTDAPQYVAELSFSLLTLISL